MTPPRGRTASSGARHSAASDSIGVAVAHPQTTRARLMRREKRGRKEVLHSLAAQRAVPDAMALAVGGQYGTRRLMRRRDPRRLVEAYARLVSGTNSRAEPELVAVDAVGLAGRATVALYRPWLIRKIREIGQRNVRGVLEEGRPLLISNLHSTAMFIGHQVSVMRGYVRYAVADSWLAVEPLPMYAWTIRAHTEDLGGRYVFGENSYAAVRELLRRGANCSVAFGLPGNTPVTFMKKRARVRSGLARLALDTGAVICPTYTDCNDHGAIVCHRLPALRPERFDGPQTLMQAVASSFERVLLERPELWEPHDPADPCGSARRLWPA